MRDDFDPGARWAIAAAETNQSGLLTLREESFSRSESTTLPIAALKQEIANLAQEPAGAGLDLPDWLEALEEEVSMARCKRRHRQLDDDAPRCIRQVNLSWEEWQQQTGEDAT